MPPPHDVRIDPHPPIAIDTYLQAEFPPSTTAPTSSSSLEQPDSLLCRRRGTAISGGCERRDTKRVVSKSSFSAETSTVRRGLNTRHDKYPDLTITRYSTYLGDPPSPGGQIRCLEVGTRSISHVGGAVEPTPPQNHSNNSRGGHTDSLQSGRLGTDHGPA